MIRVVLIAIVSIILAYVSFTVVYNFLLAGAYFLIREKREEKSAPQGKFCILIPAHNEELLLGRLLDSLKHLYYPEEKYEIVVIADNCDDHTAEIAASQNVECLVRFNHELRGKGFAISWALDELHLDDYDAVVIIDADNIVDPNLLRELDYRLSQGARVIQCNNDLANPEASWFTRILHVARVIDNTLVHYAKQKLGLSSFLMGNGMCFSVEVLRRFHWECYSLSEDYEYYSNLVRNNIFIDFSYQAKVFHQESTSLEQASPQRMRWATGKFNIIKKYGFKLLLDGLKAMNFRKVEASFTLLLPHPSMLVNLSVFVLFLSYFVKGVWLSWALSLIILQILYFGIGLYLTKASLKTILSILFSPVYLVWKGVIDIISLLGLGNREWKRTSRLK